jgi:FkbM family methyltransferase
VSLRLMPCRYGVMLFHPHDAYVGRSLELYGEFSEGEPELFRQLIKAGDIVLDVGANIGAHTLFFARQVSPTGQVLAFEPQRMLYYVLCGNLALNDVTNVACHQSAVGATADEVLVPAVDYTRPGNFGQVMPRRDASGERVPVVTIDGLALPRCHFVKVDVEGMELDVLRGAEQTIRRCRPLLYVENDRPDQSAELIAFIDRLDYAMYGHYPPLYNPANFRGHRANVFASIASLNMICVHRSVHTHVEGLRPVAVPRSG